MAEGILLRQPLLNLSTGFPRLRGKRASSSCGDALAFARQPALTLPRLLPLERDIRCFEVFTVRRRRLYFQSETYVLMEPGKSEEFVSEEELRTRLKFWLDSWPRGTLPPDLSRFETVDDAVSHLVRSVCELEIDGEVGSVQWYQVRLECEREGSN